MPEQITILTSRKSYEFRPDELRLTMLSTAAVQERIKRTFSFNVALVAPPAATFGDVPGTIPPGLVFDYGQWVSPEGQLIFIRFLHVEQRRLVIDVAGPSSVIDPIFQDFCNVLSDLQTPDGSAIIGQPEQVLDYSEISAQFPFMLKEMFPPVLQDMFEGALKTKSESSLMLAPTLYIRLEIVGQESLGAINAPNSRMIQFSPRLGTRPEERVYYSGAPLDSETHIAYLKEIETALLSSSRG